MTFWILKKYLAVPRNGLSIEKTVLTFSLSMALGSVAYLLTQTVDVILLRAMMDAKEVGYYSAGIRIPKLIQGMLLTPLQIPFLYYFSHPDSKKITRQIIEFGTKIIAFATGIGSLLLFTFADKIVLIVFGAPFENSINVLRIFSAHFFLLGFFTFVGPFFLSIKKPLVPVFLGLLGFAVNLIFDLILIPYWGAAGAALAGIICILAEMFVYLALMEKKYSIRISPKSLCLLILFGLSILVGMKVSVFLSMPVFVAACLALKIVDIEDLKKMAALIKEKKAR